MSININIIYIILFIFFSHSKKNFAIVAGSNRCIGNIEIVYNIVEINLKLKTTQHKLFLLSV